MIAFESACLQCLQRTPAATRITALQRVVNFEGYYLDGEEASSVPREPVYQSHKLDSLEAEAKYTDNRTMVRLTGRYQIKSVTLLVSRAVSIVCVPF